MASVLDELLSTQALVPASYRDHVNRVIDQLHAGLHSALVYTTQFDAAENSYRVVAAKGDESLGIAAGLEIPLDKAFCFRMATEAVPRYVPNVSQEPGLAELDPDGVFGTYAGAPIELSDGTRVGSLCVVASERDAVDQTALTLLPILAASLAESLERADEVERLRVANSELQTQATTDSLTGAANRRAFEVALAQAWKLARRDSMRSHVLVADLDRFKQLNDSRGHLIGDLALIALADALEETARETDVVGRIGGDEFAAILHGCETDEQARAYSSRARAEFSERLAEHDVECGVSIGHALLGDAPSPERALEIADLAMYDTKASARRG